MNQNPYQAPRDYGPPGAMQTAPAATRGAFILAALGAGLASAYWAAVTLLVMFGVAKGSVAGAQVVLPGVLILLYAVRGWQLFQGNPAAARRILVLHFVGGAVAVFQVMAGHGLIVTLNAVKIVIHVFGAITAFLATRAYAAATAAPR